MKLTKPLRIGLIAVGVLALAGGATMALNAARGTRTHDVPTVRVKRGNLELKVYTTGELRPARSAMLVAPPMSGTLQLVTLLQTGTQVKEGDVVAEFDSSEQEYNLEQAYSELQQAEQEITKAKADAAVQASQDKVNLLRAKFDVRRAELEVGRNELVSTIDARKNDMALAEARRKLAQLESDVASRSASSQANFVVLEARRSRSKLNMEQAKRNIDNMRLKAPISGLVAVKEAQLNFYFSGMTVPELRAGDLVWPGRPVVEVLEVERMEILAKVSENDRGSINPGQAVEVRVDSQPGRALTGKVKNVAGMAARGGWWGAAGAERKFDATFELDTKDAKVLPGTTAQIIIVGDQVRDALFIPRQAIFDKDGKPVVYARAGSSFVPREVKILNRTESQVAIEGLQEGEEVSLVNPEAKRKSAPGKAGGPLAPAGT